MSTRAARRAYHDAIVWGDRNWLGHLETLDKLEDRSWSYGLPYCASWSIFAPQPADLGPWTGGVVEIGD